LKDSAGIEIESVSYSASFPWAISADGLGAADEWIGLKSADYQYCGRSLERVSYDWPADDPANWIASPLSPGPSPGRANSLESNIPKPVVTAFSVNQAKDGAILIR